ncbi:hypothetical protein LCGC14_2082300 [marine sediment metagenome]|uniref:Uncharacterized protein n=1 Tax=marine sediment metagenome TaxID=412755 RepID=A0A0F9F2G8_9ZZZZ
MARDTELDTKAARSRIDVAGPHVQKGDFCQGSSPVFTGF